MLKAFSPWTVSGTHVRDAMLGRPVDGIEVIRQARRLREHDTDELALLYVSNGSWWVAQRLGDRLTVRVFAGDDEAWTGFDQLCNDGWVEARPTAA